MDDANKIFLIASVNYKDKILLLHMKSTSLAQCESTSKRKKFTAEEDDKLRELVKEVGLGKWEKIASLLPGRSGRQCRDRYRNYLSPGFFNGQWTQEEDDLLASKYFELGPHWSQIVKYFPNRSANSLKNRWNYFVCRQFQENDTKKQHKSILDENDPVEFSSDSSESSPDCDISWNINFDLDDPELAIIGTDFFKSSNDLMSFDLE